MNNKIIILLAFIFTSCASTKSMQDFNVIPDDCTDAVIFLEDIRFSLDRSKPENFINYYLDDINEIRKFFSEWEDLKKISSFPRYSDSGFLYQFEFYLIINGEVKSCPIKGISADGKLIEINGAGYKYSDVYWRELEPKLKRAKREKIICADVSDYRSKLKELKERNNFVFSKVSFSEAMQSVPDKYDGYFYITVNDASWSSVEKSILKEYPDADFIIGEQRSGHWFDPCDYQIYATKELYEKFDLYPKKEFVELRDIGLTVYLKQ